MKIDDLPIGQRIIARLYSMPACGEEAEDRKRLGLPVEGMPEADAIRFAQRVSQVRYVRIAG